VRRSFFDLGDSWNIQEFESAEAVSKLVKSIKRNVSILPSVADPRLFAWNVICKLGQGNVYLADLAVGLSFAHCGELGKAKKRLQQMLERDTSNPSQSDRITSAKKIVELIDSGKVEEIRSLLNLWESETVAQLESYGFKVDKEAVVSGSLPIIGNK